MLVSRNVIKQPLDLPTMHHNSFFEVEVRETSNAFFQLATYKDVTKSIPIAPGLYVRKSEQTGCLHEKIGT